MFKKLKQKFKKEQKQVEEQKVERPVERNNSTLEECKHHYQLIAIKYETGDYTYRCGKCGQIQMRKDPRAGFS